MISVRKTVVPLCRVKTICYLTVLPLLPLQQAFCGKLPSASDSGIHCSGAMGTPIPGANKPAKILKLTFTSMAPLVRRSLEWTQRQKDRVNSLKPPAEFSQSPEGGLYWSKNVGILYDQKCALTGNTFPNQVIKPMRLVPFLGTNTFSLPNAILTDERLIPLFRNNKIFIDPKDYSLHLSQQLLHPPFSQQPENEWISRIEGTKLRLPTAANAAFWPDQQILKFRQQIFLLQEFFYLSRGENHSRPSVPSINSELGQELLKLIKQHKIIFLVLLHDPMIEDLMLRAGYFPEGLD